MTIDSMVQEYLSKNKMASEQATIEKYGFDVKDESGRFVVVDPVYRKANRGKGGKYGPGGNLELLLRAAITQRESLEVTPPKEGKLPGLKGVATEKTTTPSPSSGMTVVEAVAASPKDDLDAAEEAETPPKARRTRATRESSLRVNDTSTGDEASPARPATTAKVPVKKVRRDNRFIRAFRLIAVEPSISAKKVAAGADLSEKMAGGCLIAWSAAMQVLKEVEAKK